MITECYYHRLLFQNNKHLKSIIHNIKKINNLEDKSILSSLDKKLMIMKD